HDALSSAVRASAGARVRRLSQALVIGEIALAFTLLAGSAVLVAHLRSLLRTPPGFEANELLTFEITMGDSAGPAGATRGIRQKGLLGALQTIPGVTSAAIASGLPLAGCCLGGTIYPDGHAVRPDTVERTSFRFVSAEYSRTL